jgi:hypothetical protein
VFVNLLPLNKPEVTIQRASEKFGKEGNLTDDSSRHQSAPCSKHWRRGRADYEENPQAKILHNTPTQSSQVLHNLLLS